MPLGIAACADEARPPPIEDAAPSSELILTYGHGAFISKRGVTLAPSLGLFERTQQDYLTSLRADAVRAGIDVDPAQQLIAAQVSDPFLANAMLIDWLIQAVKPDMHATMETVNGAMRGDYLDKLAPSRLDAKERHQTKGVGKETAARLEASGIGARVTYNGGQKYIDECRAAGVPIPPPMFQKPWVNRGTFDSEEFISGDTYPELWHYRSEEPGSEGLCLALPRYFVDGDGDPDNDGIDLFGLICLGTTTSKACFWDNPRDTTFRRNEARPISDFVGGYDLKANAQGVCSDCHSGENPFVFHPEKAAFVGVTGPRVGGSYYEPIVHADWPQNPGPTRVLETLSTTGRCDSCHRLPAVSTELSGYCAMVLRTAVFGRFIAPETAPATMPPSYAPSGDYGDDITTLIEQCALPAAKGKVVPVFPPGDSEFLSPPMAIGPLYGCATKVAVRGAVLDAKVTLHINSSTYDVIGRNPDFVEFDVPPLVAGDVVWAEQERSGSSSGAAGMARAVTVLDHRMVFPRGLPAPQINPDLVHACASSVAVVHEPGATVTVYGDGTAVTGSGSTSWTAFGTANAPYDIGDEFTARQQLCGDPLSDPAPSVFAVAAPATLNAPAFDPGRAFAGQELVSVSNLNNGSKTKLEVNGMGAGGFSTPISWWPNYDIATAFGRPLRNGDTLSGSQDLCAAGPTTVTPPTAKCEELPAPRIFQPGPGNRYVVVNIAVPGARVRVYDASGTEIGDGSGSIIWLSRALVAGDEITVVQQIGECTSRAGHRLFVVNGNGNGK
ncbi:MAG: hypothetical protein WKG01_33710 [Kofleriaceae bacterium]